jgi:tRNA(fMet)-specific endonuclease VapC
VAVLIDTSVVIEIERGGQPLDEAVGNEERAISVITASELLHGVHRATMEQVRLRRRAVVEHFLANLEPLPITSQIARVHAELWAGLEAGGKRIEAHDLWIAATAIAHGMRLATANVRHFERIAGLEVVPV